MRMPFTLPKDMSVHINVNVDYYVKLDISVSLSFFNRSLNNHIFVFHRISLILIQMWLFIFRLCYVKT